MGGVKRKASRSSTLERPSKLAKTSTSSTVVLERDDTAPKPPITPVKLGSKKKSGPASPGVSSGEGGVVGLRRAATLPLADEISDDDLKSGDPVTSVRRLPSGTSVGSTAAESVVPKLTSKKSSLIRRESLTKASSSKSKEDSIVVPPPLPPGGLMEIVFSFDTTGSMSSCLDQVRGRISDMMQRLQADIPGIRLAVFAHGDYCDARTYVTKWIDFGATLPELCDFVKNVESTGGGDFEECYELVLHQVGTELSWTPGSQRSLVMIGDATPHGPEYADNKLKLVWQDECDKLNKMGVHIYSVQAMNNSASNSFYQRMATLTSGLHLKLDQFSNIFDLIMAICYREGGVDMLQAYEDEVRGRHVGGALNKDLEKIFGDLRSDGPGEASGVTKPKGKASKPKAPVAKLKATKAKPKATKAKPKATKAKPKAAAPKKIKAPTKAKAKPGARKPKSASNKKRTGARRFRENVPDKLFRQTAPKVTWSRWYLGLSADLPDAGRWQKRAGGRKAGYRKIAHFICNKDHTCLFEIGVQAKPKGKLFSVFVGKRAGVKLGAALFSPAVLSKQIDAVLIGNVRVFVRLGRVGGKGKKAENDILNKAMESVLASYDYAWMRNRNSKKPRSVKKAGVKISVNSF